MKVKLAIVAGVVLLLGFSGKAIAEEYGYVRYELECGTVCFDFGEWGHCQDSCEEEVCPTSTGATGTRVFSTGTPPPVEPTNTDAPKATATDVPPTPTKGEPLPTQHETTRTAPTPTPKLNCGQNKDHDCGHGNDGDQSDNNNPHGGPSKGKGGSGRDEEQGGTRGGRHDR